MGANLSHTNFSFILIFLLTMKCEIEQKQFKYKRAIEILQFLKCDAMHAYSYYFSHEL